MDHDFDALDLAILSELDREGEVEAERLATEHDVSPSTIYYRIEQYREEGILTGTIADLEPRELGFTLTAITEVKCDYGPGYEELAEDIGDLSGVHDVYFMLGEMSFTVISRVRSHDHLQRLVDEIIALDGVEDSTTHIVLKELKAESRLLVNYDEADLNRMLD